MFAHTIAVCLSFNKMTLFGLSKWWCRNKKGKIVNWLTRNWQCALQVWSQISITVATSLFEAWKKWQYFDRFCLIFPDIYKNVLRQTPDDRKCVHNYTMQFFLPTMHSIISVVYDWLLCQFQVFRLQFYYTTKVKRRLCFIFLSKGSKQRKGEELGRFLSTYNKEPKFAY